MNFTIARSSLFLTSLLLLSSAFAASINSENLVGQYRIDAHAFNKSAHFRLKVLNSTEFEVQRLFDDHEGKICNGTFKVQKEKHVWPMADSVVFRGVGSCPDDRSKSADFKIDFKDQSLRDLEKGADVKVSSSLAAGITVSAKMKKE